MKSLGKKVRCFIIRSDGQKNRNPVSKLECFKEIKKFSTQNTNERLNIISINYCL